MEPHAYVLRTREHEIFQEPTPIDFDQTVTIDVPDAWKHKLDDADIRVLPLVKDQNQRYRDGWCTYTYEHVQAPELEVICGGVNEKTPNASAIWRQGHLLHFGFEQSPADLNENGRGLLLNSISYIAKFTEDRPIVRPPSDRRLLDRSAIDRVVNGTSRDLDPYLDWFFAGKIRKMMQGKTRDELATWYLSTRGFLRADKRAKFIVDEEAKEFGIPPDSPKFIPAAIASWKEAAKEDDLGRRLLTRYVPVGPGEDASPEQWQGWWNDNKRYLFFSDTGGFHWFVDPLAKRRRIPTRDLCGPMRATRP